MLRIAQKTVTNLFQQSPSADTEPLRACYIPAIYTDFTIKMNSVALSSCHKTAEKMHKFYK